MRVSGEALDIDALLSGLSLSALCSWRKGQPRGVAVARLHADAGANFNVSEADFDAFDQQVKDAATFLEQNSEALAKIVGFPGVERVTLDFAISLYEGSVATFSYLPPEFVDLVAKAGVGIEVSHYACSEELAAAG